MCPCIQKVASFQFMGQRINPDTAASESPAPNPMGSSLSFQFRLAVISSGKSVGGKGECVCALGGCSGPLARSGVDCVGRCCLMRPTSFFFFFLILYRRPGLHTGHIKPAEQSRLTNVRRGACEVVSLLSLTHHPALSPPTSHFQRQIRRLLFLWEKKKKLKNGA